MVVVDVAAVVCSGFFVCRLLVGDCGLLLGIMIRSGELLLVVAAHI